MKDKSITDTPSSYSIASVHALGWFSFANAVGVLLALLLVFPSLGLICQEWTYGRLMPLHLNVHLYGWLSLPLIGLLFFTYGVKEEAGRMLVWLWSLALLIGCAAWVSGVSSGKIFLDWRGVSCGVFIAVMIGLWILLAWVSWQRRSEGGNFLRLVGLAILSPIPAVLYIATRPGTYPPVNPDTGGPTGASLLGSSMSILLLLLILPRLCRCAKKGDVKPWEKLCWIAFLLEAVLFMFLKQGNSSHHEIGQIIGLGSLIIWLPLMPVYFSVWQWRDESRGWRITTLLWLALLILTGWLSFLPGWLDHLKFTNGLVAHSHLAMAGFCTSFLMLLMIEILPQKMSAVLASKREFILWQLAVVSYISIMWFSGWNEGNDAGFVINGGVGIKIIYSLRFVCGVVMLWASIQWWRKCINQTNES